MVSRSAVKSALDSASMTLISLGTAGMGFWIYNQNWISGIGGAVAFLLGIGTVIVRHIVNEQMTQNEIEESKPKWKRKR